MKIYSILKKNLRTVSRNWSYFVILFICPVLLILVSGFVLNSSDLNNVKIGVVDESPSYNFNFKDTKNVKYYDSLTDCLYGLTNSKASVCLYVREISGVNQIDIYLDNTEKIIEYYVKQFVLQNIVQEQTSMFEETSEEIGSKLVVYSTSINDAKEELSNVGYELGEQERTLKDYKSQVGVLREDFDSIYFPLKDLQSSMHELRADLNENTADLRKSISDFKSRKGEMVSDINSIKSFLSGRLSSGDYGYVSSNLDGVVSELDYVESVLDEIETAYNTNELFEMIGEIDRIVVKLESMREILEQVDKDLGVFIVKTQESRQKVDAFSLKLDEAGKEMEKLSEGLGSNKVLFEFKEAFSFSSDPVFIAFPFMVSIIITFTSLFLSNMFILKQVNGPAYFKEIVTPAKDVNFLIADYLINLFFIAIQAVVLFLLGYYWFDIPLDYVYVFFFVIFLVSSILIFIGMSLGYLIRLQSLSTLVAIFLVMFSLIVSDLLTPSILAGNVVQFFVNLNPFVVLTNVLMDSIVIGKSFSEVLPYFYKLIFIFVYAAVVLYLARKVSKERVLQ